MHAVTEGGVGRRDADRGLDEGDALGEGFWIDRALLALDQELRSLPELARGSPVAGSFITAPP
jgi:hypothetical protein